MTAHSYNVTIDGLFWSVTERALLSTTLLLIMIVSIFGNLLVIVVIARNRGMRTRTNLFLCNLAFADLLSSVLDMPFSLATAIRAEWIFSEAWCMASGFTTPLFIVASIHTLMYISVHKFVTIRNPHNHSLTKRRVVVMIVAAWVWAVIASAVSISGLTTVNHTPYTTQCSPKNPDDVKSYVHLALAIVTCYLVPMIVIIVCSVGMFVAIRSYGRRMRNSSTVSDAEIYAQQRHITVTLFLVVVTFVVCWTPVVVYAIYATVIEDENNIGHIANPVVSWFGYLNSACNPVIYAFRSEAFREGYKQVIWGIKKPRRGSSSAGSTSSMSLRQRIGYLIHRESTLSSNVFSVERASSTRSAASTRSAGSASMYNGDPMSPNADDFRSALTSTGDDEKADIPGLIEMKRLDESAAFSDVDDDRTGGANRSKNKLMVSFSEHNTTAMLTPPSGEAGGTHARRKPSFISFPSIEHLDNLDDEQLHQHGGHRRHGGTDGHRRKQRKNRGGIGGLHPGHHTDDDYDDDEDGADERKAEVEMLRQDVDPHLARVASRRAAEQPEFAAEHGPIYKKRAQPPAHQLSHPPQAASAAAATVAASRPPRPAASKPPQPIAAERSSTPRGPSTATAKSAEPTRTAADRDDAAAAAIESGTSSTSAAGRPRNQRRRRQPPDEIVSDGGGDDGGGTSGPPAETDVLMTEDIMRPPLRPAIRTAAAANAEKEDITEGAFERPKPQPRSAGQRPKTSSGRTRPAPDGSVDSAAVGAESRRAAALHQGHTSTVV